MHTTTEDDFLINNSKSQRYAITFVVSAVLLYLLLLVPIKTAIQQNEEQAINLILSKTSIAEAEKVPKKEPKTVLEEKPITTEKPVVQTKKQKKPVAAAIIKKPPVKVVHLTDPIKKPVNKVKKQESLPTTVVLLNSIKTRKTIQLSKEFQAKTGHEDDFVYKSVEQAEMFKEFKLINEEIDKPQYAMKFYSEGIEGSVERFMDKITYKKRFTTRYGTKIDCISVAIIITACGWK
jgi:hypothetical protein